MRAIAIFFMISILQSAQISIVGQTVQVEIADTPESRRKGLMGRKHLAPDTGMLFIFENPQLLSFWMKDTLIPLSIAFFDEKKKLIEAIDMPVPSSNVTQPPLFTSTKPALYALEMPQNWFREKGIQQGVEFSFLDHLDRLE